MLTEQRKSLATDLHSNAQTVGAAIESAVGLLAAADVPSPQVDARILLAEVIGILPSALIAEEPISPAQTATFDGLIRKRVRRIPLQHLVGKAWFRHIELAVGPGVFVPRPETEVLVDLALDEVRRSRAAIPQVMDLCAGSGAIAYSLATESKVEMTAVELDPAAFAWLSRNATNLQGEIDSKGSSVRLINADARLVTDVVPELAGLVDVVTCNPPYIPDGAIPRDPEVRDYDPAVALYGGVDGLDVVRGIMDEAELLLKPGGFLLIDHGDDQGDGGTHGVPELVSRSAAFTDVRDHYDLTGRPRVTTARRASSA